MRTDKEVRVMGDRKLENPGGDSLGSVDVSESMPCAPTSYFKAVAASIVAISTTGFGRNQRCLHH